jgi:hypothetical protein
MNTIEMTDTLTKYGVTLTRDDANEWGHRERWSAWSIDGTVLVSLARNGEGWYVGTYMTDVPFGMHHRVIYDAIPECDFDEAVDLTTRTLAAINIDVRYETARRGHIGWSSTRELIDFYDATLAAATRA